MTYRTLLPLMVVGTISVVWVFGWRALPSASSNAIDENPSTSTPNVKNWTLTFDSNEARLKEIEDALTAMKFPTEEIEALKKEISDKISSNVGKKSSPAVVLEVKNDAERLGKIYETIGKGCLNVLDLFNQIRELIGAASSQIRGLRRTNAVPNLQGPDVPNDPNPFFKSLEDLAKSIPDDLVFLASLPKAKNNRAEVTKIYVRAIKQTGQAFVAFMNFVRSELEFLLNFLNGAPAELRVVIQNLQHAASKQEVLIDNVVALTPSFEEYIELQEETLII